MEKDPCGACGSTAWRSWKRKVIESKGEVRYEECCSDCSSVKPSYPRDAAGNRVVVPTGTNQYSYAIDTHITGSRQLSEHLKRNNLNQR